jgi:hypothetical protein
MKENKPIGTFFFPLQFDVGKYQRKKGTQTQTQYPQAMYYYYIYLLEFPATGHMYVGSTSNVKQRMRSHRYKLNHPEEGFQSRLYEFMRENNLDLPEPRILERIDVTATQSGNNKKKVAKEREEFHRNQLQADLHNRCCIQWLTKGQIRKDWGRRSCFCLACKKQFKNGSRAKHKASQKHLASVAKYKEKHPNRSLKHLIFTLAKTSAPFRSILSP